jgi:plastocyanin
VTYVRLSLVAALVGIGLALPSAVGAGGAAPPQPLVATVGDPATPEAFRITFQDATGNRVTHVDPGTYTINVRDYGTTHNFHLSGPGVNQATDIEGTTTTTTWIVTFGNGTYSYQCDAHPVTMRGSFTSGTVVSAPPPKKLFAKVGPRRTISLRTASGAKVKHVKAGRYRITVRDVTRADNFHLFGPGVNRKTGVKAKTTVVWTVRFRKGTVRYRSDAHRRLRGSFTVT